MIQFLETSGDVLLTGADAKAYRNLHESLLLGMKAMKAERAAQSSVAAALTALCAAAAKED